MEVKQYIEKMYKEGTPIITESGAQHSGYCPYCGGTEWDLKDNVHMKLYEILTFDCNCGAEWEEHWELKQIKRIEGKR
jgi:hypothetical protein